MALRLTPGDFHSLMVMALRSSVVVIRPIRTRARPGIQSQIDLAQLRL